MRLSLSMFLAFAPMTAVAQSADTVRTGIPLLVGDSALRLPTDRVEELIQWAPGGGIDADGHPNWRGRPASLLGRSIDGVTWGGLVRTSRFSTGIIPSLPSPSNNSLASLQLVGDAYSVRDGSDGPGLLLYATRPGGTRWEIGGSAESGEPFGPDAGPGNTRLQASAGGPLVAGWRFRTAGSILGRRSAPVGIGYADAPYFVPTGIDTTYTWEIAPGDSVAGFAQSFSPASRVPSTPRTATDAYARLDGAIAGIAVWARYLRGTEAEREFSYLDVSNPGMSTGRDGRTQDLAAGVVFPAIAGWTFGGHISWQEEESRSGPIAPERQLDTRDPSLGMLVDGIGLRYTFESFPIDEQLMWNYRGNISNSRRSPYDLENTDQYRVVDNYRNNPYGVVGFSESGGPTGTLELYRDRRVAVQATAAMTLSSGILTFGVEDRSHDIQSYRHALTSQAFSDVWLQKPVERALFADWTVRTSIVTFAAGARIDRFDTRARRPRDFPRIRSMGADLSGSDREEIWDSISVADKPHSAFSARFSGTTEVSPGFFFRAHLGRFARTPDLGLQLAGINTDIAITNSSFVWGSDYGHELTDVFGAGITKRTDRASVDLEVFQIRYTRTVLPRLVSRYDPVKDNTNEFGEYQLLNGGAQSGATIAGHVILSPVVTLRGTFTRHFKENSLVPFDADFGPGPDAVRPNALAISAEFQAPGMGPLGGLAAVVGARRTSGLARTVVPYNFYFDPYVTYSSVRREGTWTSIDLTITKAIPLTRGRLAVYLDARNLLNAENLVRAFISGNATEAIASEAMRFTNDSSGWAREGSNNGVYDNGTIDLTFGGAGKAACGGWVDQSGTTSPPNCAYLINAEARFGDADGHFSLSEQQAASRAYYLTQYGRGTLNGPPREIRIGARLGF